MYHLIVVDDNQGILDLLRLVIEAVRDWSVEYVSSPEEALELCRNCDVLTILTDIQMLEMNGDELVARVRALDSGIAAFAMTGGPTSHLSKVQFEHVFKKPIEIEDMIGRLTEAIERQAGERAKRRHPCADSVPTPMPDEPGLDQVATCAVPVLAQQQV